MLLLDATVAKHFWETDLFKILATAVVTVSFIEPLKVWLNNYFKLCQIRRSVLAELSKNLEDLDCTITLHAKWIAELPQSEVINRLQGILELLNRTAYDGARKDFYLYHQLPEGDWINAFYGGLTLIQSQMAGRMKRGDVPTPELMLELLADKGLSESIKEINARGTTRRMMGRVGIRFVRDRIKPRPFGMLMRESWRGLMNDLKELKAKSE